MSAPVPSDLAAAPIPPRDTLREMANAIRALTIDAVEVAKSGHPGMPMGIAEVATVLATRFLRFDAAAPRWPDRDRLILSAGHGSMLLYALAYLLGYDGMTLDQLRAFRKVGSRTPGHPEIDPDIGVEMTTGPLGQGIATAVGFALAERTLRARFGADLVDHRTFVIASDGDLMEGVSHEAASLAGHQRLSRLIVLWDDNGISIDGPLDLAFSEDPVARYRAYGWAAERVDGHDPQEVAGALDRALASDRPTLIACRTIIGFGSPNRQGTAKCHGAPLGPEEAELTRAALGWPHEPFVVPAPVLAAWRAAGGRGAAARQTWEGQLAAAPHDRRAAFLRGQAGTLPDLDPLTRAMAREVAETQPKPATRAASGAVLEYLVPAVPELFGGSADLTGNVFTLTKASRDVTAEAPDGNHLRYGVREHAMAAAMNGMAAHGGLIPYAGTFLSFADYSRPAIRLGAIMKLRVIHVMTHDSIGLGEDGPTHQPIEHLAALRAMPNLRVFRPADQAETAEAWRLALERTGGPTMLVLSRQALPTVRTDFALAETCPTARGAYLLAAAPEPEAGPAHVALWASGSEVHVALAARDLLAREGIRAAVVSVPSLELFLDEDRAYCDELFGLAPHHAAIEAGVRQGWDAIIGREGVFVGMDRFGESGPGPDVYAHFGITPQAFAAAVRTRLSVG